MSTKKSRPGGIYLIMGLLLFQGLSGLAGGFGLASDPTGASLQIPASWLEGSPFNDYLVPGLILLVILGIFPLVVLYGLWSNSNWSWFGVFGVGAALVIWIGIEISVIGYHSRPPLQAIYSLIGIAILVLLFLPSVRRFFKEETIPEGLSS